MERLQGPSYHLRCDISLEAVTLPAPHITTPNKRHASHFLSSSTSQSGCQARGVPVHGTDTAPWAPSQHQDSTPSLIHALSTGFLASSPWDRTFQVQTTLPSLPVSAEHVSGTPHVGHLCAMWARQQSHQCLGSLRRLPHSSNSHRDGNGATRPCQGLTPATLRTV